MQHWRRRADTREPLGPRLDSVGALRAGCDADLVVLDHDLRVSAVMVHGDWRVQATSARG